MKSNVYQIANGAKNIELILKESERVAAYNGLDHKQTMHLRLLCEELDGMIPELMGDFEGKFWIEFDRGVCKVNVSIQMDDIDLERRDDLIGISKNKKNAATTGIVGKIRAGLESLLLNAAFAEAFASSATSMEASVNNYIGVGYSNYWSLDQYKGAVKREKKAEAWDELEKSVIANIADDVIVGIKGRQADIIIVKKFA